MTNRRDFLASAVAFAGLVLSEESLVDEDLLYVGTYTDPDRPEGIYLLRLDRRSGELRNVGSVNAGANPSFLALHPKSRVLYAVNEVDNGGVSAFAIAPDTGTLMRLGQEATHGSAPCYVSVDARGRVVLVANYDSGSVALLPIASNGGLAAATSVDQHTGSGPNADRQSTPHAHCIVADPSNRFALAADLGTDRVLVYRLDLAEKALRRVEAGDAVLRPGAGPRHIAFHPTLPFVFISNELDSTVVTLRFDAERGALSLVGSQSTVPAGWTGTNYPADIHIDPSGRTVYVSNRGHNRLAVFSIQPSTGALSLVQMVSTEGDWPRNFTLDRSGRWLLVANERSNSIVVFNRDEASGKLTLTRQRIAIPRPVCLRFHA